MMSTATRRPMMMMMIRRRCRGIAKNTCARKGGKTRCAFRRPGGNGFSLRVRRRRRAGETRRGGPHACWTRANDCSWNTKLMRIRVLLRMAEKNQRKPNRRLGKKYKDDASKAGVLPRQKARILRMTSTINIERDEGTRTTRPRLRRRGDGGGTTKRF